MALVHSSILILAIPSEPKDRLPSHIPRVDIDTVTYRVRATSIVLTITLSQVTFKEPITQMLLAAHDAVRASQMQQGLGLVPGGEFVQQDTEAVLRMWNANNHQLTWRVVGVVITGLLDWILLLPHAPAIVFKIFDGPNQVGLGQIIVSNGR